jgi:hypothetical protein
MSAPAGSNKIQIKRTAISGRTPNTTTSANGSFIDTGELALNLTDGKMFSSNGSVFFEVGANLSNLTVTSNASLGKIVANGNFGSNGQTLFSDGTTMYWGSAGAAGIFPLGDYGTISGNTNFDAFGVSLDTTYDAHAPGAFTIINLEFMENIDDGGVF